MALELPYDPPPNEPLAERLEAEKSRTLPVELPPEWRPPPSIMDPDTDRAEPHAADVMPLPPPLRDATSRIEPPAKGDARACYDMP